ncbi:MAG: type III toxin-antitoxin system ToxN/AbiQ family toxin [Lachnospiraceae bacterium]|nr:type III toxin-antitoxin system ToxN/AbiQ family toxin [Lachnospiraceae bacterium]
MGRKKAENLKLYRVSSAYVDYLVPYAEHLFHNRQKGQQNERMYIGIILKINGILSFRWSVSDRFPRSVRSAGSSSGQ